MFTLKHDEVEASGNVVEGTIFILGHSTRALMDSGASHSFVSESFACTLSESLQPLESDMAVATLGGEELLSSQWFSEVAVEVSGHCLVIDLKVLKMHNFDVIFRMDWLSRYCAHLDTVLISTALSTVSCSILLESLSFSSEVVCPCAASLSCLFLRCVALFVLLVLLFLPT